MAMALAVGLAWPAYAQGAAVALEPASAQAAPGGTVVLQVVVRDVVDLYGFEAHLGFDASLLEVIDADAEQSGVQVELLEAFLKPQFVAQNQCDNAAGTIDVAYTQTAPSPAASGSGVVARIVFRAKGPGDAIVLFTSVILADDKAQPIPATVQGATLTIRSSSSEQEATPTATATAVPGSPTPTLPSEAMGSPVPPTSTPTSTPTPTAVPTDTPVPEAAETPTPTVEPTAMPAPTDTPVPESTAATEQPDTPTPATPEDTLEPATPTAGVQQYTPAPTEESQTTPQEATATVEPSPSPGAAVTPTATEAPSPTATPVRQAMAVEETPSGAGTPEPAPRAVPAAAQPASPGSSLWVILAVVAVLIVGFGALVVLPRERRLGGRRTERR